MLNQANLDNYKQRVIADFNSRSNYDNDFRYRSADPLVQLAQLQSGQEILDVATGTGIVAMGDKPPPRANAAAQIVGTEGKVIGVDISRGMLSQAQQKIEAASLQNIELIEADADHLNFNDNSFDVIFCSSAIPWFSDIPGVLRSWYRFLKKDGLVAFSCVAEKAYITSIVYRAVSQRNGIPMSNINEPLGTLEKCHSLLQAAGFMDIEIKQEQFGDYISLSDIEIWWDRNLNNALGNPLLQLNPEKLEQCKAEYMAELEALATDKGIWNDITTFFVLARK